MTNRKRIVTTSTQLSKVYQKLRSGDVVASRLRLKYGEEHLLLDLMERGVKLIPSATSQLASRSKTFQARLLAPLMVPHTVAIYDIHGLLDAIALYSRHSVRKVILKHDRKNAGLGIHLFRDIEDVYTQAANNVLPYPFVLQPFVENSRDVRVIIIGDYVEAYERNNPDNFRNNLHCGGEATPFRLNKTQLKLCHKVMKRGSFPWAHLDLMITEKSDVYLAEINLRGGMRGAAIDSDSYREKVQTIEEKLLQEEIQL
jgi:glutathione synthase/RimK-type ligase-like ATP-grasp enzyme